MILTGNYTIFERYRYGCQERHDAVELRSLVYS